MTVDDSEFSCAGSLGGAGFISGTPICQHQTGLNGELEIVISNLKSSNLKQSFSWPN